MSAHDREEPRMKVTRAVILDLLPAYLAGEASADTRALVEEYLQGDEELARYVHSTPPELTAPPPLGGLKPEAELRALRRTRRVLAFQRWLFALATLFTAGSLATRIVITNGHISEVRPLVLDEPRLLVPLALAVILWIGYVLIRRRLRAGP